MNYAEVQGKGKRLNLPTRAQLIKHLETGGMPGIAFARDPQMRSDLFQDWIDLTCQRDLFQFKRLKLDSDLAYAILKNCALLEELTWSSTRLFRKRTLNPFCVSWLLSWILGWMREFESPHGSKFILTI